MALNANEDTPQSGDPAGTVLSPPPASKEAPAPDADVPGGITATETPPYYSVTPDGTAPVDTVAPVDSTAPLPVRPAGRPAATNLDAGPAHGENGAGAPAPAPWTVS